ncbi:27210_t:CDS:1, partial [Dentiscutata erythropus]
LFLICLVFSHASPLPRDVGDKAVVELEGVDGKVTFTQVSETNIEADGIFKKGITENTPERYFVKLGPLAKKSFKDVGIKIVPPGTKPWKSTGQGLVKQIIGVEYEILHDDDVIASGIIKSA